MLGELSFRGLPRLRYSYRSAYADEKPFDDRAIRSVLGTPKAILTAEAFGRW
jgi:hypothetical protein